MSKKNSIFKLLSQKPWDPDQAKLDNLHEGSTLDTVPRYMQTGV